MYEIIKWDEFTNLIMEKFNIKFTKNCGKPDLFGKDDKLWIKKEGYEDLENIEVIQCLEEIKPFVGVLYIIADASYRDDLGPFKIQAKDIYEFANKYCYELGEYFVNTDLMIFNFELGVIWIFHHSGFYDVISFK